MKSEKADVKFTCCVIHQQVAGSATCKNTVYLPPHSIPIWIPRQNFLLPVDDRGAYQIFRSAIDFKRKSQISKAALPFMENSQPNGNSVGNFQVSVCM
jgi:hypothetical protein